MKGCFTVGNYSTLKDTCKTIYNHKKVICVQCFNLTNAIALYSFVEFIGLSDQTPYWGHLKQMMYFVKFWNLKE